MSFLWICSLWVWKRELLKYIRSISPDEPDKNSLESEITMHEDSHIHQEWALKLNPLTGAKRFQVLFEYLQNTCQLYFILNLYILMKAHITLKIFMRANIYHIYYVIVSYHVQFSRKGQKPDWLHFNPLNRSHCHVRGRRDTERKEMLVVLKSWWESMEE